MKTPRMPKAPPIPHLPGTSKEAPGLKTRQGDVLHKALGMTDSSEPIHPMKLAALADSHPDPKVRKAAKSMLGPMMKMDRRMPDMGD